MKTEELVNTSLVKQWAAWGLIWLTVFPLVGLLVSIKFHNPDFLGGMPWLTFGRLRREVDREQAHPDTGLEQGDASAADGAGGRAWRWKEP